MTDLRISGPLVLHPNEEGGWRPAHRWWVEWDELRNFDVSLANGSVEQRNGRLTIFETFRFDGGSGPAKDTPNALEGFGGHDARYRLSRHGLFGDDWGKERVKSDRLMYLLHRHCGVSWLRSHYLWLGVRVLASDSARPQPDIEDSIVVAK